MNPWLQRFLISWAAGVAASGAIVSTAKKPGRLKKKRRKKKKDGSDEPVQLGATALHDARMPEDRGITVREWRDNVVATTSSLGSRVKGVFSRDKKPVVTDDGVRLPDEVQARDGTRLKVKKEPVKKRKGSIAKGRQRGRRRRRQATLWDSAKESLKQTVKETVKEEVQASPVGTALDALKNVGAKVREGATSAATAVGAAVNKAMDKGVGDERHSDVPAHLRGEIAPPEPPPGEAHHDKRTVEETLDAIGKSIEGAIAKVAEAATPHEGDGANAASVDPAEVAKKVKGGLDVVGSWLQGPGAPGYGRRVRPASGGDVVEAKDAAGAAGDVVEAKDPVFPPTVVRPPEPERLKAELVEDAPLDSPPSDSPPSDSPLDSPPSDSPPSDSPPSDSPPSDSPPSDSPPSDSPKAAE